MQRRTIRTRPQSTNRGGCARSPRLIIALVIAAISIISFLGSRAYNPITEEEQYVSLTPEQEIAMGLDAAPVMIDEFGGLEQDAQEQTLIDEVGEYLVVNSVAGETEYPFEFYLLDDGETVNAFALPGGPIFITDALFERFTTEAQVAGVLAHEIAHVIARHSSERIAEMELTQGLTGAFVLATYDPDNPNSAQAGQIAAIVGQLINLQHSREHELQADELGVRILVESGYDPRALIEVMQILAEASGGDQRPPEFLLTHPYPENRIERIREEIDEYYPDGVPEDLEGG